MPAERRANHQPATRAVAAATAQQGLARQSPRQSGQDVHIELVPRAIIIGSGVTATELDCVMRPQKDLPGFLLGPVKKGDEARMRMAAVYHMTQDRISRAGIYRGQRVEWFSLRLSGRP